ncbi:MAG TPA: WecB/TagA/CpsF family glycosyltransferase [Coleofasciculaceae cyanobacterium]
MNSVPQKVQILNVVLDNITKQELLDRLKIGGWVTTPNIDHVAKTRVDEVFDTIYHKADYLVCYSQLLIFIAKMFGQKIVDKISGSDFLPVFYNYYAQDPDMTMFLLGAREGVAAKAQQIINQKVGREMVTGVYSPPFGFERDPVECKKIVDIINASRANVLVLGVGAPKQEKWFYRHHHLLKHVTVAFGFGASIDFEAGNIPRSPHWMSQVGLEWLFRLSREPKRLWRRYSVDSVPFFVDLVASFLGRYRWQRPIAVLLQEAGFLTEQQLRDVIDFYELRRSLSLGQILVAKGAIQSKTLHFFEQILPNLTERSFRNLHDSDAIVRLCEQAGLLTPAQLKTLETAPDADRPEGLAIERGWLTAKAVRLFQVAIASGGLTLAPEAALYRAGAIDFDWIATARAYQRNPQWLTLGEVAVAKGLISYELLKFVRDHCVELSSLPHAQAVHDRVAAAGFVAAPRAGVTG